MLLALWAASFTKTTRSEIDLTRNLIEFRIGVRSGSGLRSCVMGRSGGAATGKRGPQTEVQKMQLCKPDPVTSLTRS